MQETMKLRGIFDIELRNAINNELIRKFRVENTVVTTGRAWVLNNIQSGNSATTQTLQQLAVGTGITAPATSQTALVSEAARKAIGTFDNTNLTSNPPSFQAQVSFATNEANTTLGEVALFNSSAGGTMLARSTFSTIDKATSNTLSISYTISN